MAVEYYLEVKTAAGVTQAVVLDARYISYSTNVNAPGILTFAVRGTHPVVSLLERDGQVNVWRRDAAAGIDWYVDFYGLFRDEMRVSPTAEETEFTAYCIGTLDFLKRSTIDYPAGVNNRSQFTAVPAEVILKTLVTRNATSNGTTADGRVYDVPAWGGYISVEAAGVGGNTLTRSVAGRNLLDVLQEIGAVGNLDFKLAQTGARAWEFRTDDSLGDDRTEDVIFSLERGNMRNPKLSRNRLGEATLAIVAGAGEENAQIFRTRTGANYDAATNARAIWVSEPQISDLDELDAAGDAALTLAQARDELTFDVVETPATRYGLHYFFGDLVTAKYQEIESVKQIAGVSVVYQDTGGEKVETIQVLTENWH